MRRHVYTDEQIRVAQVFGSLAALAVRQAALYAQLNRRALVIDRQRRLLEQVAQAHKRLTDAALGGADVARDRPAALRPHGQAGDRSSPLISTWPPPPRRPGWPTPPQGSATARGWPRWPPRPGGGGGVILPAAPHAGLVHRQLVCPLIADEEVVGYLAVAEVGSSIRPLDVKVVEQGAMLVSLLVLAERRQAEAEGQAREDFLTDLLHGARGAAGSPPAGSPVRSRPRAAPRHRPPRRRPRRRRAEQRAAQPLARRLVSLRGGDAPLTIGLPGADMVLLALPEGPDGENLSELRRAVSAAVEDLDPRVRYRGAAVSKVLRRVSDYAEAHRELRALLEATRLLGGVRQPGRPGHRTRGGPPRRLRGRQGLPRFAEELLGPLVRHDRETQSDLMGTLRRYLECGGQIRATARSLDVHENTVRYRLTRIAEVSDIDPADLRTLLDARFALQVLDLIGDETPTTD